MSREKSIYVLDTNVLMHDPTALFKFQEHDIYLPMIVLEELDAAKKGMSEVARNVRQVSRFLNELMEHCDGEINGGVPLIHPEWLNLPGNDTRGFLRLQTNGSNGAGRQGLPDNQILEATLELRAANPELRTVLVSKDINLRIKAMIQGLPAEDYQNDRALDDLSMLFTGAAEVPEDFWDQVDGLNSWTEGAHTLYEFEHEKAGQWHANQFLYINGEGGTEATVEEVAGNKARLRIATDFRNDNHSVWGITARNREQNFALNLLLDDSIDFVTLMGTAGTGKTLLSLAAGLAQTLEHKRYSEIIMTRATVPVGEDIGFLPGTEEEKMTPWMGALTDNLEFLTGTSDGGDWGRAATNDLVTNRIKIRSLNFMRGRTFLNRYVIIDEAQNLTPKQMKTLLTRAGPGTKMVCLGNVEQIDTPYLTETTSGLTYAVDRFKGWEHSGHVTLTRGERSRLADFASEQL
ncbi:MAG: PhoH family protein [Xanthomonadales bacterium]|nr:PhoH family protein [Xanthomonadales bacterium]